MVVKNNSGTTVLTIPSGGYGVVILLTNVVAAGTWDTHFFVPSNVSWSTNTLDYAGSITSATWNGTVIAPNRGGTGVANSTASTLTISGAFPTTLTVSASTSLTLPTSGTVTALGNTTTGSGSIVLATSPTITSPIIGITSFADYWQPAGSSATQATVAFQALGTDTNINVSLTPKGTGAIIAGPIPDGTATGGNARGANAIDLQTSRTAAGQVATGANSVTIGNSCTATSQYDIAIGYGAYTLATYNAGTDYIAIGRLAASTGAGSVALGFNAQSAGQYSIAIGYNAYSGAYFNLQQAIAIGYNAAAGTSGNGGNNLALGVAAKTNNTTNANNSAAFGYQAWVNGQAGKIAFGTGSFTTAGDSQFGNTVLRATTTATTAKVLTADSGAAGSTNVVNIPQNAMFLLSVWVVARETASGAVAGGGWKFDLMVSRGTGNVAIVGTVTSTVVALSSTWSAAAIPVITADTTNQGISITVTPPNTNSTHWVANVMSTEVW